MEAGSKPSGGEAAQDQDRGMLLHLNITRDLMWNFLQKRTDIEEYSPMLHRKWVTFIDWHKDDIKENSASPMRLWRKQIKNKRSLEYSGFVTLSIKYAWSQKEEYNADNSTYFIRLLWRLDKKINLRIVTGI